MRIFTSIFYTYICPINLEKHNTTAIPRLFNVALGILLLGYIVVVAADIHVPLDNDDDWQQCSSCQNKANTLCGGYYVQPSDSLLLTKDLPANQIIIKSGYTKLISKGVSHFSKGVVAAQNKQLLVAERAEVIQNSQSKIESIQTMGNVRFTLPGIKVTGNMATFFPQTQHKIMYNADYRLYNRHARGNAIKIEVFANDNMNLEHASYTTCQPGNSTWLLTADKLKLNKSVGRGEAWHAKMHVKGVPVFYWPYLSFSIDDRRTTGFLVPTFSSSSKHGVAVATPWYWNIATNYDYTIKPTFMTKRGVKLGNQLRYLNKNSLSILNFNLINRDKAYKDFVQKKRANPGTIAKSNLRYRNLRTNNIRYSFNLVNNVVLQPNWAININYNKVSDSNYLQDFGQDRGGISTQATNKVVKGSGLPKFNFISAAEESLSESSLHLEQSISIEHSNDYGLFNFKTLQYQTLYPFVGPTAKEQYKKLPEVIWDSNYVYLPHKTRSRANFSYVSFKARSLDGVDNKTTGQRLHFRPTIERPVVKHYGYVKPRLQLDLLSYRDLQISHVDKAKIKAANPSRVIPIFDISNGLYFYRNVNYNWQQTLEPKVYYLYVPKVSQDRYPVFDSHATDFNYHQLFRDNRYSGLDRVAAANQVTFGMKSRVQLASGEEKASIGIARAKYFSNLTPALGEKLQFNSWSPIAILADYRINPQLMLEANVVRQTWNRTRSNTINSQYKFTDDRLLNLSYQYNRFSSCPEHQWQASGVWAVKLGLNLLGKVDYDIRHKRVAYSLAGIEIEGCCSVLRFAWVRSKSAMEDLNNSQYNNKLMAQVIFKGFTDVGTLENNYLSGKIAGYKALEKF